MKYTGLGLSITDMGVYTFVVDPSGVAVLRKVTQVTINGRKTAIVVPLEGRYGWRFTPDGHIMAYLIDEGESK